MKASLPEVNQFTGNCLRMVCKVSKQNCFEIKISQRHDWETPSQSYYDLLVTKNWKHSLRNFLNALVDSD